MLNLIAKYLVGFMIIRISFTYSSKSIDAWMDSNELNCETNDDIQINFTKFKFLTKPILSNKYIMFTLYSSLKCIL